MWWKRRRIQGLLAASLYEELTDEDRRELESALASSAVFRAQAEALGRLVRDVPSAQPRLDLDLCVPLRRHVDAAELSAVPSSRGQAWWLAGSGALAVAVLTLIVFNYSTTRPDETPGAAGYTVKTRDSGFLMEKTFAEARRLLDNHQPVQAYELLRKAVKNHPKNSMAGHAQLQVADLAYELGLYPEALEACNKLMAEPYRRVLDESPERLQHVVQRRDLLTEAKTVNFRSLHAFDSARRDRGNELVRLEEVIVQNQEKLVADLAAEEMGRLLLAEGKADGDGADAYLNALKAAHERCTNPYAVALLDLKIGDIYRNELKDYPAAETHYRKALENPVLARRAQDALGALAAAGP